MTNAAHSLYPPSGFAQMVQCAGSRRFQANYPDLRDPTEREEGEAAHWAAQTILLGGRVEVGLVAPNGVPLSAEMVQGAGQYADAIFHTRGSSGAELHVERPVAIPQVHPESWGTPDCCMWLTPRLFYAEDFKFGRRGHDPFEHWQLIGYASGKLSEAGNTDPNTLVVMRIHQPRYYSPAGPMREWKVFAHQLAPYVARLRQAAAASDRPDAPLVTGPACRDCRARHDCPAAQAAGFDAAEYSGRAQPLKMSPEAAGLEYRVLSQAADRLKARISGLEEQLKFWARSGMPTPHVSLQAGQGRRVWDRPASEVRALGHMMGVEVEKPLDVITPRQAQDKGLDAALVAAYSKQQTGEVKLVIDDGSNARRVFSQPVPLKEN